MDSGELFLNIVGYLLLYLISILITRELFGINNIIRNLEQQNKHSLSQVRLLIKLLKINGISQDEVDTILEKGNKTKEENKTSTVENISQK